MGVRLSGGIGPLRASVPLSGRGGSGCGLLLVFLAVAAVLGAIYAYWQWVLAGLGVLAVAGLAARPRLVKRQREARRPFYTGTLTTAAGVKYRCLHPHPTLAEAQSCADRALREEECQGWTRALGE